MSSKNFLNPEDLQTNWKFFNKLLENNDYTKMNMMDICRDIYEKTYMMYGIRFLEEYYRAEELTAKVVEKVGEIEVLNDQVKKLTEENEKFTNQIQMLTKTHQRSI